MNLTLYQLNNLVRETIELSFTNSYWVEAELSECRESNGHCYMELVEKGEGDGTILARAQAKCWRTTWTSLRPRFERITGQKLHAGLKVLLRVKPQFHEAYGFSWIVNDIDPNFTMGDMARKRQEIIRILKEEGVFDLNKSLDIPMFAQRIAVISSATAAGYGDFCNQIVNNEYGFKFKTRLFQAVMQGELVEQTVIDALNRINDAIEEFDVVVIIRGGGGTSDLTGFDTLALAENVTNFPLPIITGIGHDRDESILDMVSCVRVKTPTAAADYLINNLANTQMRIDDAGYRITQHVRQRMERERLRLSRIQSFLPIAFSLKKTQQEARLNQFLTRITSCLSSNIRLELNKINNVEDRLPLIIKSRIERERYQLDMFAQRVDALDPIHILHRGYAIALHDGKAVKRPTDVKDGEEVTIMLAEGVITTVKKDN